MKTLFNRKNTVVFLLLIICLTAALAVRFFSSLKSQKEYDESVLESVENLPGFIGEDKNERLTPPAGEQKGEISATPSSAFDSEDYLEQEKRLNELHRPYWWRSGKSLKKYPSLSGVSPEETGPLPVNKDLIFVATDTHYYPSFMTDYGTAFEEEMDEDDGKDIKDIDIIMDRWIDTIIEERPATVILSGDLTLNGEKDGHIALAEKLDRLTGEGIQVLVEPGNHDINCIYHAATYFGKVKTLTETVNADEFRQIYHAYGYDQAFSLDDSSLSYLYKIDETHWVMMLDTAVYDPVNEIYGTFRAGTLEWMEQMYEEAEKAGAKVLPVSHQNLLSESRYYRENCTITNNLEGVVLSEQYGIKVWFSGHLHLQRIKKYLPEPGAALDAEHISEIVTGSFAMYPFHYGKIKWTENGSFTYDSKDVNVPNGVADNGREIFKSVITGQEGEKIRGLPEDMQNDMVLSYAQLLEAYVAGDKVDETDFKSERGFQLIERFIPDSVIDTNIQRMLADTKKDNNHFEYVLATPSDAQSEEITDQVFELQP